MKRLWPLALLAAFAGTTPLFAGAFGLFYCCKQDCCNCCQRPANAFAPGGGCCSPAANAFTPPVYCCGACYAGCNHNCWSCAAPAPQPSCGHHHEDKLPVNHTTLCNVLRHHHAGYLHKHGGGCADGHCGESGGDEGVISHSGGEVIGDVQSAPVGAPAVLPQSAPSVVPSGTRESPIQIPHAPTPEAPMNRVGRAGVANAYVPMSYPMVQPISYQYPGYNYPMWGYYPVYPAPMYNTGYYANPGWYPAGY